MNSTTVLNSLRHDFHKTHGASHESSLKYEGIKVSFSADKVGGSMSRKFNNRRHNNQDGLSRSDDSHYRISLITKERTYQKGKTDWPNVKKEVEGLYTLKDVEKAHKAFLNSKTLTLYNEDYYNPYTSLKYHTLIVTALAHNLSNNIGYEKLFLHISPPTESTYTTIYQDDKLQLDIAPEKLKSMGLTKIPFKIDNGSIQDGYMWFGKSWGKLSAHTGVDKYLDSQLRRIGSWSTALQLIEDWREHYEN